MTHALKIHGGKSYLAKWIISHFPEHTHYVEPFFGGGSVMFQKPDEMVVEHSEVANDLDRELTNFWRVMQCEKSFRLFQRKVEAIPFSMVEWKAADPTKEKTVVDRAVAFFIRLRQSRQGLGTCFATMSRSRTRRGMNEQASSWWSAVEGLEEVHRRLQRVVIADLPATRLIAQEDSPHTLFYVDPPYLHSTRVATKAYTHEMSEEDHEDLLRRLSKISGRFVLSGYNSSLYEWYAHEGGWRRVEKQIDNKASGKREKPVKTECLWMNFG